MQVSALLQSLRQERDQKEQELEKLDQAISVLSRLNGRSNGVRPRVGSVRRARRAWTPAMRRAAAKRMKLMWKSGKMTK